MIGTIVKDYKTLIMDGSNKEVVDEILNTMDVFIGDEHVTCEPLDSKHPTIIVINTKTDEFAYAITKAMIEKLYPGLCIFNPPM